MTTMSSTVSVCERGRRHRSTVDVSDKIRNAKYTKMKRPIYLNLTGYKILIKYKINTGGTAVFKK